MPYVDGTLFKNDSDWTEFYGNIKEELPHDMLEPLGKAVRISYFVDANHAGNVITKR